MTAAMENQPQQRASDLRALAEAKLSTLSDAEKLLLEKVPTGDFAICGPNDDKTDPGNDPKHADNWGPARQVRAELIGWVCMDQNARKHVHWRGIQLHAADVTGPLDLSFANLPFPLALQLCHLKEAIDVRRAELSELDLQGSLVGGISADGVIVKNNVLLRYGFAALGVLWLPLAQIGGDLDCSEASFTNPPQEAVAGSGNALIADRTNVKGSVFLNITS